MNYKVWKRLERRIDSKWENMHVNGNNWQADEELNHASTQTDAVTKDFITQEPRRSRRAKGRQQGISGRGDDEESKKRDPSTLSRSQEASRARGRCSDEGLTT